MKTGTDYCDEPFFVCVFKITSAEETNKISKIQYQNNSIFIEFFGNSLLFGSINYERFIFYKATTYLSSRIGIGYGYITHTKYLSFPILFNLINGVGKFATELGIGFSLMQISERVDFFKPIKTEFIPFATAAIGFRITC